MRGHGILALIILLKIRKLILIMRKSQKNLSISQNKQNVIFKSFSHKSQGKMGEVL